MNPVSTVIMGQRKVAKGDVLLTSKPFVFILNSQYKGMFCDTCFKRNESFLRCSRCLSEWYCNVECQKGSWAFHRYECKNLKRIKPSVPSDIARLLSRIIMKLKKGGDQIEEKVTETMTRKFKDLMSHYRDIKDDARCQEHLTSLKEGIRRYIGSNNVPNDEDFQSIYGQATVNGFSITHSSSSGIGTGVYLAASVFDHSCKPNAYVTFVGTHLVCRSAVDWPSFDWTKVRVGYMDDLNTTVDRRNRLHNRYYFWCDCSVCQDKERDRLMSSINCGNTSCDAAIYVDEKRSVGEPIDACNECGFQDFSPDTRLRYYAAAKLTKEMLDRLEDEPNFDLFRMVLERQQSLFHKRNILRVKLLNVGPLVASEAGNYDKALQYGVENVDSVRFYYGESHPSYAMMLLILANNYRIQGKMKEALKVLREAEGIIRVSHGTSHPTYTDELKPLLEQTESEIKMQNMLEKYDTHVL